MDDERAGTLTLPGIGLGTLGRRGDDAIELVGAALAAGYRWIDTGRYYGNEEEVGEALHRSAVPRDEVLVTTKLLHPNTPPMTDLRGELERSLRSLRTDHVDLLLIHWPDPDVSLEWALGEFAALRDAGEVREIGVSNFTTGLLDRATSVSDLVVVNQVEYHPFLSQSRLLDAMRRLGVTLTAHTPLARGRVLDDPVLDELAAGRGVTAAQVVLAWLVRQRGVVAVPGAATTDHLRDNLAALDLTLSDDEVAAVDALAREERVVDPPHGPTWDLPG